jgi:D-xylose transport system ATP-binding protein
MADPAAPLVAMQGIAKSYGGVEALKGVDLAVYGSEVHALVGDNAAGKSTLIKILAGAVPSDAGTILFEGREVRLRGPRDAKTLGIETVYQDLALADNLDVPSNIFMGRELMRPGGRGPFLDLRRMEREARALLARLKINIPEVRLPVRAMSGGQRQCVAIARTVYFNARVVILDEPTAALGVQETEKVHALVRQMRGQGLAVLLVSHNLRHVFDLCDRITVLKNGRLVGSRRTSDTSSEEILRMIVSGEADPPRSHPLDPEPARFERPIGSLQ